MAKTDWWLRLNKVNILQYLPAFLSKDDVFRVVNNADSKEHDKLRLGMQDLFDNINVDTATWGLDMWEDLLQIKPSDKFNYMLRRKNILSRLRSVSSVTLKFMQQVVDNYTVNGTSKVVDRPHDYMIDIHVQDGKVLSFVDLIKAIRIWIPAHIGWQFIALSSIEGSIYGIGAVSIGDIYHVPAQLKYEVDNQGSTIYGSGVVSIAEVFHVKANIYQ